MKRSDKSLKGQKSNPIVPTLAPFDIEYRLAFERLWVAESTEVFRASKPGHISDLFSFFFEKSQTRVQLFFDTVDPEIFDRPSVVESAKQAIAMGRNVEVIFKSVTASWSSPFLQLLAQKRDQHSSRVFLNSRDVPKAVQELNGNFGLVDSRAYIFGGYGSAYDPGAANSLSDLFSSLKLHVR